MSAPADPQLPAGGEHGGDGPAVAEALGIEVDDLLDLSQSLNPFAPDPRPVVAGHVDAVARYPDPRRATDALAEAMGVDADRLLLTNGGAEAIALVATELRVGRVDEPDFALYRRHLDVDPSGPRFRSNPHNPTGLLARADERAAVWDEAFYPLATGSWTRGDAGSLVVGSLTKLLACPGLRLGYVLAPTAGQLELVARRQPAWSVNGLAAAALPDLLATVDLTAWSAQITESRAALVDLLAGHGLVARPSDAPWVLVDLSDRTAASLRAELAVHGVLVRDCSSFGMPHTVRIAVPAPADRGRLARALGQVLPSTRPRPPDGPSAERAP
jgi:histidinol-phosphate/aromatic aminotransferase/cobyric acid decarboxylase-like protein